MSLYAPYSLKHLYPFSTTTMYAWIDKEPIKRRVIFVIDKDNKKRRVKRNELWPIAYDKLFSKIKALEKEKDFKEKVKVLIRKIKENQNHFNTGFYTLEFVKKMSLENCFWETSKIYVSKPYEPDYCTTVVEENF